MKFQYDAHKVKKDELQPLHDHIIVTDMHFDQRITNGGIILLNDDMKSNGIRPRWARIYKLGHEYDGPLKEGQYILVSHGRWTRGIKVEDESGERTLRRVDPNDILLVSDELREDETMGDKG